MSKKGKKKPSPSAILRLAASFDEALFNDLVRRKENELRDEFAQNGISKRLFNLEKRYGSRDTAYRVLAEEKVWSKIYSKQDENKPKEACKLQAEHKVALDNGHRIKARHPSHKVADSDYYSDAAPTGRQQSNWRNWGYN